jgi:hypothetical protein
MPFDLRMRVVLWSLVAAAAMGLGFDLWKNRGAAPRDYTGKGRWRPIGTTLGRAFSAAFLVGLPLCGLLIGCNGTFRSTEPFVVDGWVVDKYLSSGRYTSYLVVVQREQPRQTLRFTLGHEAYQHIQVGDHYHEEFQLGLFGWPCRPQ